jgi:hypothetical protein
MTLASIGRGEHFDAISRDFGVVPHLVSSKRALTSSASVPRGNQISTTGKSFSDMRRMPNIFRDMLFMHRKTTTPC